MIEGSRISINSTVPIHIIVGKDEFTDEDIREWARGNLESIDFATGQESLIIECLAQIIVETVLKEQS
jgi:hypothetical protein